MMELYDYQEADVEAIINHPSRSAVVASVVGTGKTLVGVEVIRRAGTSINLIIAPPNTYDSWARTFKAQTGEELLRVSNKDKKDKRNFINLYSGLHGTYFIGWEQARRDDTLGIMRHVQTAIGDEVHRASNRNAKSALLWEAVCKWSREAGGYRVALSATPWGNKPSGAWAVTRPLWPSTVARSFWKWAYQYINVEINEYKGRTVRELGFEKEPGAIARDLPLYIRHERYHNCCKFHPNGVQTDLPERVFHDYFVDLTPTQRKIYNDLEADMFAWIEDNDYPLDTDGYPMVNTMRMHQATLAVPTTEMVQRLKTNDFGEKELMDSVTVTYDLEAKSSKIDAVLEILEDQAEDERVLIFTHSTALVPALVHRINKKFKRNVAAPWTGSQSQSVRQDIKNSFTGVDDGPFTVFNGEQCLRFGGKSVDGAPASVRIIVAQISAIAEGVDGLQNVCNTEVWVSATDNRLHNTQAKGRLLRNGQKHTVQAYRVMARDTIEEAQMERLFHGEEQMTETLKVGA